MFHIYLVVIHILIKSVKRNQWNKLTQQKRLLYRYMCAYSDRLLYIKLNSLSQYRLRYDMVLTYKILHWHIDTAFIFDISRRTVETII